MKPGWLVFRDEKAPSRLAQELGLHPALAHLLSRRGIQTAEAAELFLNPSLSNLEDPMTFHGMARALERIRSAIARGERILVYGDYDVDGITGSAILYPILRSLGAHVDAYIPNRATDGYGLNRAALERLLEVPFSLLVTVDNGITAVDEIQFLKERGIDTIIVDHHLPKETIPPAYAIVSAAGGHDQGQSVLAACGVAWKLAWALCGDLEKVRPYLDLVAIGTLADVAPATGDNRILLRHGLESLRLAHRPGIRALMNEAGIMPKWLSTRDVAFGLAPRINASGRMGSPMTAFKLLTSDNSDEVRSLARLLEEGNRERQKVEEAIYRQAAQSVEADPGWAKEKILIVSSDQWHEGVIGIVAARLAERFHRPAVVIAEKNSIGKGSGRTVPGLSIHALVKAGESWLTSFGGHDQACGLTLDRVNIARFREAVSRGAREADDARYVRTVEIESALALSELTPDFVRTLERLEPFGPGNSRPVFMSKGLRFKKAVQKRGKDTLSGWVTDGDGKATCEIVGFRCYERFMKEPAKEEWSFAYRPSLQTHNGIASIQLELVDWV